MSEQKLGDVCGQAVLEKGHEVFSLGEDVRDYGESNEAGLGGDGLLLIDRVNTVLHQTADTPVHVVTHRL